MLLVRTLSHRRRGWKSNDTGAEALLSREYFHQVHQTWKQATDMSVLRCLVFVYRIFCHLVARCPDT